MSAILSLRRYKHDVIAHSHDHVQLVFGLHGRLDMEIAGRGNPVMQQMVAVIPQTTHHACGSPAGSDCLVLDIPDDAWLERLGAATEPSRRLLERPAVHCLAPSQQPLLDWLARSAVGDPLLASQGAALLLTLLANETSSQISGSEQPLLQLFGFIDRHLAHPLQVTDLARQIGLSPSRLHARFLAETGSTPMAFIRQRRLQRGRQLLQTTRLPVGEIAARVGYASQSAFTAALARAFGDTPRALRREARDK